MNATWLLVDWMIVSAVTLSDSVKLVGPATCSVNEAVDFNVPEVPVTGIVYVPGVAVAETTKLSGATPVEPKSPMVAVTPAGNVPAASVTVPVKPPVITTLTFAVAVVP